MLKKNLIYSKDTARSDINVPIISSFDFKSINKRNNMEYLSDLTIKSFAAIKV